VGSSEGTSVTGAAGGAEPVTAPTVSVPGELQAVVPSISKAPQTTAAPQVSSGVRRRPVTDMSTPDSGNPANPGALTLTQRAQSATSGDHARLSAVPWHDRAMTVSNPVGWRLAPGVVRLRAGRFAGGSPFRVVRLSERGVEELNAVLGTCAAAVPGSSAAALIRKLIDYGLLLAPPRSPVGVGDVTVVIPALSTAEAVQEVLDRIPEGVAIVLVDDGSATALAAGLAPRRGLRIIRHQTPRGPAAARNAGVRYAHTRWVVFLDADVLLDPNSLGVLRAHADDPGVVAVAPRVVSVPQPGGAALMERWSGALDLGGTPSDVGPGRTVSFVPTAALMVDRQIFDQVGGFAEQLHVGEDVDLVWRMGKLGRVRYQPDVVCQHRPRPTLAAVVRRRFDYGTSAAALERRHPGTLRHADVSIWSFAPWLLGVVVHPAIGLVAAAGTAAIAPWGMRELPPRDAVQLAARGHVLAAAGLGRYLIRPLWPVTLAIAVAVPARRRVLAAAVLIGTVDLVRRWVAVDRLDPARLTAIGKVVTASVLDDAAYSLGVWAGCRRERNWKSLLLRVRDLPKR
jgi:mycofactocin system glycosyltransferase